MFACICHFDARDEAEEPLVPLTATTKATLLRVAETYVELDAENFEEHTDIAQRLVDGDFEEAYAHAGCYDYFTNKKRLTRATKRTVSDVTKQTHPGTGAAAPLRVCIPYSGHPNSVMLLSGPGVRSASSSSFTEDADRFSGDGDCRSPPSSEPQLKRSTAIQRPDTRVRSHHTNAAGPFCLFCNSETKWISQGGIKTRERPTETTCARSDGEPVVDLPLLFSVLMYFWERQ